MSKITSIFRPKGNLGGVNFYVRNGQLYARNVNSLDGNRIKTDPAFQRTREINQEFAGIATASKGMRTSLNSTLVTIGNPNVTIRMNSVMRRILNNGEGPRGERTIDLAANKDFLVGFEWDEREPFSQVFPYPCEMEASADRLEITLTIPPFNPLNGFGRPVAGNYMRFLNLAAVCPNYSFNKDSKSYEPVHPQLVGKHAVTFSDYLPINEDVGEPIALTAKIDLTAPLPVDTVVVGCIGIQFFDQHDGVYSDFRTGSCMRILKAF